MDIGKTGIETRRLAKSLNRFLVAAQNTTGKIERYMGLNKIRFKAELIPAAVPLSPIAMLQ
jgi:hypothetical protein